jgi:hypothetical protein
MEVVVEIERVQLIRKRIKTHSMCCEECGRQMEFISICEAADLFSTDADRIFHFITHGPCHFRSDGRGNVDICLVGFLETMRIVCKASSIKSIGDGSHE